MSEIMADAGASGLLIQDPQACAMAEALMRLTGQSLDAAVATALCHAVEQAERRQQYHERIMAITRDIAAGSSGW